MTGSIYDKVTQLSKRYDFVSYGHAGEILLSSFPGEYLDILKALDKFKLTTDDILAAGGNESQIPKAFDSVLYPLGWREMRISADLVVHKYVRQASQRKGRFEDKPFEEETIHRFVDGHNVDFVKGRVAVDCEWNSKEAVFSRDIGSIRCWFDSGLIDVGVIITRAENLNDVFKDLGVIGKYGASTTWMGKLTYRLDSRQQGGCPILAVGIRKECVEGYK